MGNYYLKIKIREKIELPIKYFPVSKLLEGLNPAQKAAVINFQKPSLIIAGAGSGKTRVLTARIAYMLENGVAPHTIMALTFTNKAAAQMKERLAEMIDPQLVRSITMGTFHSIFSRIIRENAEALGYPTSYTIYQPADAKSLIKTIVKEMDLDADRYKPNVVLSRISFAKNSLITPAAYQASAELAGEDRENRIPKFGEIYATYCTRCKASGALDFDDLLLQTNILFKDFPEILARYQQRYQYLLVDEYQDTNYAQYIIIRRLAQLHGRVCVVGDDAQSIYSFRGAKIENILNFRNHFPTAETFKLEQNYRSTQTIVDAANSLISHNQSKLDKRCFSAGDMGEKIRVSKALTDRDEASMVVNAISERARYEDVPWSEFAILYRTNSQSQAIEQALRHRSIPYQIYRGNSFYEHKEIKDILAYIRLVINPRDDEAFKRIINYPARGIGGTTLQRIEEIAKEQSRSMWDAVDTMVELPPVDAKQRTIIRKVKEFVELIRSLSLQRSTLGLYDFGLLIATMSGILPSFRLQNIPEAASAVDNIEELLNTMRIFEEQVASEIESGERSEDEAVTLEEWLQNVMLLSDQDSDEEGDEKVTLMTVHSSKGLEYGYVYIVGVEHNLFPSQRAMESGEIEEERRLFYVAITRAKKAAMISFCNMRFKWGNMESTRPSSFLGDIDPKYLMLDEDTSLSDLSTSRGYRTGGYEGSRSKEFTSRESRKAALNNPPKSGYIAPQYNPNNRATPAHTRDTRGMKSLGTRTAAESTTPKDSDALFEAGDLVVHKRFGEGEVTSVISSRVGVLLKVEFKAHGEKSVIADPKFIRVIQ